VGRLAGRLPVTLVMKRVCLWAVCLCVSGVVVPVRGDLRDGHVPQRQPRHLHVQHAVRLQVPAFTHCWMSVKSCVSERLQHVGSQFELLETCSVRT